MLKKDGFNIKQNKYCILNLTANKRIEAEASNKEQAECLLDTIEQTEYKLYNTIINKYIIVKGSNINIYIY